MLIGHCSCLLCLDEVLLDEIMSKDFFMIVEMLKHDVFASVGMNELEHKHCCTSLVGPSEVWYYYHERRVMLV